MLPLTYYELAKIVCLPVLRLSIEHPHHHRDHPHHQWHHYHHHQHDKGSIFSGSDWIWGQRWGKESDSSFRCHLSNDLLLTLHLKHLFLWSCRPSHFNICSLLIYLTTDITHWGSQVPWESFFWRTKLNSLSLNLPERKNLQHKTCHLSL